MNAGFDIMRAAFPGDPTTGSSVSDISLLRLRDYAERILFRDAQLPLSLRPRLLKIIDDIASETDTIFTMEEFCSKMDDLKYHAEFSGYDGDNTFTDFTVQFGRLHSADRKNLGAFKHFAYVALGQYVRSHNQFAKRPFRQEAIHFFHVFDDETNEQNWHCHFILIPT